MSNPFDHAAAAADDDDDDDAAPDIVSRHDRGAIHEKPLSAFISSVPEELCGPTAEYNPFQFWNRDSAEIDKWSEQINDAIQTAVTRHHRGFNQATTEFDEILSAFHDSEIKFKRLISNLLEARKLLHQSRGENGKTASIAKQWKAFESYKKKLKELDKIEYILEIPQIFEKYLTKKQFIHSTVLLEDGLSLYATSLTQDSSQQLQSSHHIILNKKNDLEKLLRQQLYQQIYFKTNSLRNNLLRPPKRKTNKNILNLLNFQKEMMMMGHDDNDEKKQSNQTSNKSNKSNNLMVGNSSSKSPHYKNTKSVHYDTLASLNKDTNNRSKSGRSKMGISSSTTSSSLQDPYKIIVPTYKSFRNLDDIKDDSIGFGGNVEHLLVAETTDEYLKLAHNNNNYNDDEQPLFLTICVTAIDKLGRSVGAKTNLFKSLDVELKEIIDREIYEICNSFQQQMIQSNQMTNIIEPEDQSLLLLNATQNVFKIFTRVLSNHKTVINVFNQTERTFFDRKKKENRNSKADKILKLQSYTIQSVWNGIQKAILNYLLIKYLDIGSSEDKKKGDFLDTVNGKHYERSPSPSPSPTPSISVSHHNNNNNNNNNQSNKDNKDNNKSFGKRLKDSKFFKRRRNTKDIGSGGDNMYDNDEEKGGGTTDTNNNRDLFSSEKISDKYHDLAMDALTFSFADSNKGSIVLESEFGTKTHVKTGSEFAAKSGTKRISLSQANFNNLAMQSRGASPSIQLGIIHQGRERTATGLDAFSMKTRQKRGVSMAKHRKKASNKTMNGDETMTKKQKAIKAKRRKQLNLIESSPYHVTKLYKPIIHFVENAEWKILGLYGGFGDSSSSYPLRSEIEEFHILRKKESVAEEVDLCEYLIEFVRNKFIPNMQAEAYYQMGQVLLDNQPMDQIRLIDESLLLLKSTSGIFDLIKTLFEYYIVLPVFDSIQFTNMITKILSSFRDTYQQAIDEISDILISRDLIYMKNGKYLQLLSKYKLRILFENCISDDICKNHKIRNKRAYEKDNNDSSDDDDTDDDDDYDDDDDDDYDDGITKRRRKRRRRVKKIDIDKYSYESIIDSNSNFDIDIIHFINLQNEDKIPMSHSGVPTFNTEYYSKLALISTGLFWMNKKITSDLITPITHSQSIARSGYRNARLRKSTATHASLGKLCSFLSETFEPRSEKCISIIRMELRSQCVCLLKNISKNNYWMPEDSIINKPQDFIITLNKLLVSAEGKLNGCLPEKFIKFLFQELAYFICEIIIYEIPLVKSGKINHVGYKQLYKNTFSLQQNLTTITQKGMEKCFDRAQKYLKLSQKTPDDIAKIQDIKNKKYGADKEKYAAYNFTKDQYDSISTVAKLSNAHRK